ncbi:MAG: imidazolonepropionase [Dehalococcoidia bacterium]
MLDILIKNASELVTCRSREPKTGPDLDVLDIVSGGDLAVKGGRIAGIGIVDEPASKVIDASGKTVLPGFVDCHTHLVFSGSREEEFAQNIQGADYLDILREGGGILSTVRSTRNAAFSELMSAAQSRIRLASDYGTTTIEVKSGYGLDLANEMKMLMVVGNLRTHRRVELVPTFLGAHAFPPEFDQDRAGYVHEVLRTLDELQKQPLAEYCDVFVEEGAFGVEEAGQILERAISCGLKTKLHAGEFSDMGGVELGVDMGVTSIDHLDYISEEGMRRMAERKIIGVLLPGVPFHLMTGHYAPARRMIEAGVPIALATDFNPGSCPTLSMQMIVALACRYMRLTAAEAINASTINAAHAVDRGDRIGSLEVGKQADIIILDIPNHRQLPYWFGMNLVERVIKNGRIIR